MNKPDLPPVPNNEQLLEALLTAPGSDLSEYTRFHNYSARNLGWFLMQGISPQPVATYNKWRELNRQVRKGEKAAYVLRPITVKSRDEVDEQGQPKTFRRFKPVKAIFGLDQTDGEPLPRLETREWSLSRALGRLAVEQVDFTDFDGNTAGYSYDRKMAVSPVAVHPLKTALHELAHIQSGHTTPENVAEYGKHRGRMEFEAEAPAYLTLSRLGELTEDQAASSRSYCQSWLRGEQPSEASISKVLRVHDELYNAGLEEVQQEEVA
jgi:antirestriction protein ArdC